MPPCAWCILQRFIYLVIGIVALIGWFLPSAWSRFGAVIVSIISIGGAVAAWHQHAVASQILTCSFTFADRFISDYGLDTAAPWLFGVYATCADAAVEVLGVEYAVGSLVMFAIIFILSLGSAIFKRKG